jgi:hypothetical protein
MPTGNVAGGWIILPEKPTLNRATGVRSGVFLLDNLAANDEKYARRLRVLVSPDYDLRDELPLPAEGGDAECRESQRADN